MGWDGLRGGITAKVQEDVSKVRSSTGVVRCRIGIRAVSVSVVVVVVEIVLGCVMRDA